MIYKLRNNASTKTNEDGETIRRCSDCKEWLTASHYYKDTTDTQGFNRRCKPCCSERMRNYYESKSSTS
jgi:hypothetical protein